MLAADLGVAAESPFAVEAESGFLLVTRVLDREEQAEYRLQVGMGLGTGSHRDSRAGH